MIARHALYCWMIEVILPLQVLSIKDEHILYICILVSKIIAYVREQAHCSNSVTSQPGLRARLLLSYFVRSRWFFSQNFSCEDVWNGLSFSRSHSPVANILSCFYDKMSFGKITKLNHSNRRDLGGYCSTARASGETELIYIHVMYQCMCHSPKRSATKGSTTAANVCNLLQRNWVKLVAVLAYYGGTFSNDLYRCLYLHVMMVCQPF